MASTLAQLLTTLKTLGTLATLTTLMTFSTVLLLASPARAYFSTIDNGEVLGEGKLHAAFEPQIIFNRYEGVNATGRLGIGINDESSAEALLGFGKVDFQMGGFYKFIPFPDTATQPAIGGKAGVVFARINGDTELSLRLHPLVSKSFQSEIGDFIPYASLPFGITSRKDETVLPLQIVGGSEFRPLDMANVSFFGELGINVVKAFSYVSAAVVYRFDESAVRKR